MYLWIAQIIWICINFFAFSSIIGNAVVGLNVDRIGIILYAGVVKINGDVKLRVVNDFFAKRRSFSARNKGDDRQYDDPISSFFH